MTTHADVINADLLAFIRANGLISGAFPLEVPEALHTKPLDNALRPNPATGWRYGSGQTHSYLAIRFILNE